MSWARIMAPLSGGSGDEAAVAAAVALAEPFGAEMLGVYTPADVADALQPYVDAGCRTFNLLTQSPDSSMIPGAVGEVRRLLASA